MIALITAFFYLTGVLFAIEAVMTSRTSQGAVAWAVSLVSFPFVSVPAYLVFGRNQFEGMVEAYEEQRDEIDALSELVQEKMAPHTVDPLDAHHMYQAIKTMSGHELTTGNSVELLIDGEATFDSIIEGIAQAEDYILFQFYIVRDDGLGMRILEALSERAAAGVRVYFLYDEVGSHAISRAYLKQLRDAGIHVSAFNTRQGRRNRFQLNFRNHRKIVVVDGKVGWVGGLNVGDEYLGLDEKLSPFRDTHSRLEGPVVTQLQGVFVGDWYWAQRELPVFNWEPTVSTVADKRAMIMPSAPSYRVETAGLMFVAALQVATDRIWIAAPYFVPDEAVMKALELAAMRGVDVRILTTGQNDSLAVHLAAFHYIEELLEFGIRFFAYEPGFMHQKVMLVDDSFSTVGTANFDNRSFRLNFEVTALISDEAFAGQIEAMFLKDFEHSSEITQERFEDTSFFWRLGVNLSRLAAPVL